FRALGCPWCVLLAGGLLDGSACSEDHAGNPILGQHFRLCRQELGGDSTRSVRDEVDAAALVDEDHDGEPVELASEREPTGGERRTQCGKSSEKLDQGASARREADGQREQANGD